MMKHELEHSLGEPVSESIFLLLQAIYMSDAAPSLGGEEGRQYLKAYLRKNRVQIQAMATLLAGVKGNVAALEEELGTTRRGLDMLNRDAGALRADVVRYMDQVQTLNAAKLDAEREARSKDLDVQIATAERDRLKASLDTLAQTLDLMGLDVEKIGKLASGVAANQAIAGQCEGALNEEERFAQEVGSLLVFDFPRHVKETKKWEQDNAAARLAKAVQVAVPA